MKNKKQCNVCEEYKSYDLFDTYKDKKSGLDVMKNHCRFCRPVECPACRETTLFKVDGKVNPIKFFKFERRSFYTGWPKNKVGWLCNCGYLVAVTPEQREAYSK